MRYTAFASLDGVVNSPGGGPSREDHKLKVRETEEATALMFGRPVYDIVH